MRDVARCIEKRQAVDTEFALNFEKGVASLKIGVFLRQAREAAGLTQEGVVHRLQTQKSVISRIENHADDVRLSPVRRYSRTIGAN
ncbi:MAG: helix-turn-helix domain-containing protein [Anaerolineales bacterium]|nr:helix-turn-helix domain-containing protein [Anaerolineales bacterium]